MSAIEKDIQLETITASSVVDQSLVFANEAQVPRGHLGMSGIGNPDSRTLWLKFRWSLPDSPAARTLRIFELGNILEDEVVRLLKGADFDVWEVDPDTGKQFNFKFLGGHFAGSADGVIRGIPETQQPLLLEIKSAKNEKFKELEKLVSESSDHNTALKKWNMDYFGQTQCYMPNLGLNYTLFVVYNKNTSALLFLKITPEKFYFEGALGKAERIIESFEPPESSFPNRNWYEIKKYKSEHYQAVYWGDELPPSANCRNCRHSLPNTDPNRTDAAWVCKRKSIDIPITQQAQGCGDHNFLPALMPAELIGVYEEDNAVHYRTKEGNEFFNAGEQDHAENVFSSKELIVASASGFKNLFDPVSQELRAEFKGRLVEEITLEAS